MRRRVVILSVVLLAAASLLWVWHVQSSPELTFHVVTLDPRAVEIRPVVLDLEATRGLTFSQIVAGMHPYAAINGTFYGGDFRPLGDVMVDGKLVVRGRYPNAVAVRDDGGVEFVRRSASSFDWRGYRCALAAGPRLVHNGEVRITASADGFARLNPKVKASRSGIGLTHSGRLLLVVCKTPVDMWRFAELMRDLGAVEAMNLDGGPACGLYHNGNTLVEAQLRMTNLLVAYRRHAAK